MKLPAPITADYATFLAEVKGRIHSARLNAGRAVNSELVLLYWDIGRGIVEKQRTAGWGDAVVERLASDLRAEFPGMTGFSADNVWRMRQFYSECVSEDFLTHAGAMLKRLKFLEQPVPERPKEAPPGILEQAVPESLSQAVRELAAQVPWGHHIELLKKVKDYVARHYYLRATAQFGWSRAVLLNQIKAQAYERAKAEKKTHNFAVTLPEHFAEQADEMLKSRYNLEFLGIARPMKERELEDRLIGRLQQFILELGYGFCFVGRQYRLALGQKE